MTLQKISAAFLLAAVLLIPANALAINANDLEGQTTTIIQQTQDNKLEPDSSELPNPMQYNIETNLTELKAAHSEITNLMITQNDTPLADYTGPDLPLTVVYIDDDTLVVGLDPAAAYFDVPVEPEYIQFYLGIDEPVEILYMQFQPESHATDNRIKQWQDKYKSSCQPVKPGYQKVCEVYKKTMASLHVPIPADTTVTTPAPPAVTTPTLSTSPCTDSPKSSACYYYKLYQDRCTDGKTHKRCGTYVTIIKNAGYALPTDSSTNTPTTPVVIPSYDLKNIKTAKSGDSITVYWDAPTGYTVKYYKIYVSEDGGHDKYKTRIYPTTDASYTLSGIDEGKTYKFKIKLYYTNDRGSTSIKYFYSDVVSVPRTTPVDTTPPVITVPSDISQNSTSSVGMAVSYATTARDDTDGIVPVQCSRVSGATFAVGDTVVTCTATDKAGNKATASFTVTVTYTPPIIPADEILTFYGGTQHNIHYTNATGHQVVEYGTITFGATNSSGVHGMVTSGHAVILGVNDTLRHYSLGNSTHITMFTDAVATAINSGNVDAAFTPITDPDVIVNSTHIEKIDGSHIPVLQGTLSDVPIRKTLGMYGIYNNTDDGMLYFNNATVMDNQDVIVYYNMGIGNYNSIVGDSGAPVIYHNDNGTNYLVGVHRGSICVFDSELPDIGIINVTKFEALCNDNDTEDRTDDHYFYKIFSAWENVKIALTLQ
jgi:hypothetical protein